MLELKQKIAQLEAIRPSIGDAAADAAIRKLYEESGVSADLVLDQHQASDGHMPGMARQMRVLGTALTIESATGGAIFQPSQTVVQGDQINQYYPSAAHLTVAQRSLIDYLRRTLHECGQVQLRGIATDELRHLNPLRLEHVYVTLQTETTVHDTGHDTVGRDVHAEIITARPLSVVEALGASPNKRLMLLGLPGSGKTTFINHLALCLAGATLSGATGDTDRQTEWLQELPGWEHGPLIPVRIILRDAAKYEPLRESKQGSDLHFKQYLQEQLAGQQDALDPILDALSRGEAILLFDGLDEVVGTDMLKRVAEMITAVAGIYTQCPVLVTCRLLDYHDNPLRQLRGFQTETIAALDNDQVTRFIQGWYNELQIAGRQFQGTPEALRQAIGSRSELRELTRLPLLLTMMSIVHAGKGTLPDTRAVLYAEAIEMLLLRWRQEPGSPDVIDQLGLPQFRSVDLLALMGQIGYTAHDQAMHMPLDRNQPTDLTRQRVQQILEKAFESYTTNEPLRRDQLVSTMLHSIATRNGLLLKRSSERGEIYAFPHRTFQEFLAGYHLKSQRDYLKKCLELTPQPHWHETIRLMVGYQVIQERALEGPLSLVQALLSRPVPEQILAGEILSQIGFERLVEYDPQLTIAGGIWRKTWGILREVASPKERSVVAPALRARAALVVGTLSYTSISVLLHQSAAQIRLPDPRLPLVYARLGAATARNWRAALTQYWCAVEAGWGWTDEAMPDNSSTRMKESYIDYAYYVGRYPVTNAEYARYVTESGYPQQAIDLPAYWDNPQYNNPIQPVVGVSWFDVMGYCSWLTRLGHQDGWLAADQEVRLPTTFEWERAARHTSQRRYPWGNEEPTPDRANYNMTAIGAPTAIGCFPKGAAVCGAMDLAGNIMEWMVTPAPMEEHGVTPSGARRKLVSGGAFRHNAELLACSSRYSLSPFYKGNFLGFRLIIAPRKA